MFPHLQSFFDACQAAFFFLTVTSAITTHIIDKTVDEINKYGNNIGVVAYKGGTFVGMTWAATIFMLLGGIFWVFIYFRAWIKRGEIEQPRGSSHPMQTLRAGRVLRPDRHIRPTCGALFNNMFPWRETPLINIFLYIFVQMSGVQALPTTVPPSVLLTGRRIFDGSCITGGHVISRQCRWADPVTTA